MPQRWVKVVVEMLNDWVRKLDPLVAELAIELKLQHHLALEHRVADSQSLLIFQTHCPGFQNSLVRF